ncbi:T9SS type A sorting domain-containing protein [Aquimarina algiphila]|uniref:T9SS type A sorting domain-containing protein n=1 Tax=Aquimarina algiphila TaxID=2047982 RepID=UPI00232D99EC|nr:T9SS type A sorting domain-containing protein [Aquimarina algiphila]
MMKYKIFVSLLLLCALVSGQGSDVHINNFHYFVNGDENICENEVRFTANFSDGTDQVFFQNFDYREGNHFRPNEVFTFNKRVISINAYVYTRERRGGRSCGSGKGSRISQDVTFNTNMNPCVNGSYEEYRRNGGEFEVEHRLKFTWLVTPRVSLQRVGSDIAGYEDDFRVRASEGFNSSVYRWQYQITNIGQAPNGFSWSDIPGVTRNRNLAVTPSSFLPLTDIGKEIHIRTFSCTPATPPNTVSFKLRRSAPHIINNDPQDVNCYDTEDGSIKLTFDRPLETGDNLNIAVVDLSTPIGTDPVTGATLYDLVKPFNTISFDASNSVLLDGLPASILGSGFRIDIIGGYNGLAYFSEAPSHTLTFDIGRPTPVAFIGDPGADANKVDVWCNGGSDGTISLEAIGGVGAAEYYEYLIRNKDETWTDNWIRFSGQFTHTIENLPANTYYIKLRDANGCVAKIQDTSTGELLLGAEDVKEVIIDEPDFSVSVNVELVKNPSAFGFEDGRIQAIIQGGTAKGDNTYNFEWRDEDNNIVTTTEEFFDSGNYVVALHSIGKGSYTVRITDANYDSATNKEGCTETSDTFVLEEPDPIIVQIDILNPISCNIGNTYDNGEDFNDPLGIPDQFQDGALIATVTGGVPFDKTSGNTTGQCRTAFRRYCYRWKKNVSGVWQDIAVNDSVIRFQSVGTYALNVEDKNGIVLGTYEEYYPGGVDGPREYRLVDAIDSTKYLPQPDALGISFTKTVVTCANGNDAQATVSITGGTPPYTYLWSNGKTTPMINNLIAGTYLVFVEDAKGCQIEGTVVIDQPNGLEILPISEVSPTCFEGDDGRIEVNIQGGNPPYTTKWNTGSTATSISGLTSGTYLLEVIDAKGCKTFYEKVLIDPDPIVVNLEDRRSLCGNQSLNLDIAIDDPGAVYSWFSENGFSSSENEVEITQSGRYVATITSSLGCIGIGEIEVEVFDTPIDSDFLITTQAYTNEEVILVNVSEPMGETVEWTVPEGVEIISQEDGKLVLKFESEGPYDINLRSYQLDCYQDFTKTILVQPAIESPEVFASQGEFIEEFIVYPNPNEGTFKTKISLAEESNIKIKIVNLMSGATMHERIEKNNIDFLLDYSMSLPTGVYLMLLETPKGTETRKLIFE